MKALLGGDKYMPEIHLKQLGFTYSLCGPFTENSERIQKFEEAGDSGYLYQNELDNACICIRDDMAMETSTKK